MDKNEIDKKAVQYINKHPDYAEILNTLRHLIIAAGFQETIKWGLPAYSYEGKVLAGIGAFKAYAGIWFFQGALLKDEKKVLINAQEGKTKALRQLRFHSMEDLDPNLVSDYLKETIDNHLNGREIKPERKKKLNIPAELGEALEKDAELKKAYSRFTAFKMREFADYISEAKLEATRQKRLQKVIPMIFEGKGLNDRYRKA